MLSNSPVERKTRMGNVFVAVNITLEYTVSRTLPAVKVEVKASKFDGTQKWSKNNKQIFHALYVNIRLEE